jgi:hypothetical protein
MDVLPEVDEKDETAAAFQVGLTRATREAASEPSHNRKRPAGEAGRFWGYYREERYVSLYMWIRGR